jgi:hypothetical protein
MAMRNLTSAQLIELWNPDGATSAHWRLEPLLAVAANPGDDVSADTLGRRNQRLLEFHQSLTSRPMAARSRCTSCGTDNEFVVPVIAILGCPQPKLETTITLRSQRKQLRFRLPTMADVRTVIGVEGGQASAALASACLIAGSASGVTSQVIARLDRKLEAIDPASRILLDLDCAECGVSLHIHVDVAELVSSTVDSLVDKALRQVHVLARAYGWSERAILEMPASRRLRYLALATASSAHGAKVRAVPA